MIQFVFLEELFCSFKLKGIVDKLLLKYDLNQRNLYG